MQSQHRIEQQILFPPEKPPPIMLNHFKAQEGTVALRLKIQNTLHQDWTEDGLALQLSLRLSIMSCITISPPSFSSPASFHD